MLTLRGEGLGEHRQPSFNHDLRLNAGKSNALGAEAQIATRRRLFSLRPGRPQDSRDGGARTSRTTDFQHPDALE